MKTNWGRKVTVNTFRCAAMYVLGILHKKRVLQRILQHIRIVRFILSKKVYILHYNTWNIKVRYKLSIAFRHLKCIVAGEQ